MVSRCGVENCQGKYNGKGYCGKHYMQIKKHGKILTATVQDDRPPIITENFVFIPLGVEAKHGWAIIDKEFIALAKRKWTIDSLGYPASLRQRLHTLILLPKKGFVTDHKNQNKLDNTKSNLRYATRSQNGANHRGFKNKTGFRGVWPFRGGFSSQVRTNGICHFVGNFKTATEAARAYDKKALEVYGEFACLNFP